jgi:hypothetical protein
MSISVAPRESAVRTIECPGRIGVLWKRVCKPRVFGFAGLLMLVAVWGFGYKLSLYQRHSTPSQQASVAKLWVDSPKAAYIRSPRLKCRLLAVADFHGIRHRLFWLPRLDGAAICVFPVQSGGAQRSNSPFPLRSPPSRFLCNG